MPGKAKKTIEEIENQELAQIAWAEYYFFSAKAKECVEIVEKYRNPLLEMKRLLTGETGRASAMDFSESSPIPVLNEEQQAAAYRLIASALCQIHRLPEGLFFANEPDLPFGSFLYLLLHRKDCL